MKQLLEKTLNILNNLNDERISLVYYHPNTMELIIKQLGSVTVRLNHLVGFIDPIKHTCILYPEDLKHIRESIRYILESESTILLAPIKNGYRVWKVGDIAYSSKPRHLTDIVFYSVYNKFLINYVKYTNEEVKMLFRTGLNFNK